MMPVNSPAAPTAPVRIGLLGMYASANLGDTAIQQAVMGALNARRSNLEFVAICTAPEDAARTFGLNAHDVSGFGDTVTPASASSTSSTSAPTWWERAPRPLSLAAAAWRIDHLMRRLDMLLVSGSGQIDDFWGGPWEQPFRLRAWAGAARRQQKPVAFFGVGVDQLLTRSGSWLAMSALGLADQRVVRDPGSRDTLQRMGFAPHCDVCPDPAFHLEAPPLLGGDRTEPPFVVISPIVRKAWPGAADAAYANYLQCLADTADHLIGRGLHVRFVCSQTRMDPPVIAEVRERMRRPASATSDYTPGTVQDYIRATQPAELVIASRLHALILAMVGGTPVVAASYARKVTQQMTDAGLGANCLELATLEQPVLLALVDRVLADLPRQRAVLHSTVARFRDDVDQRFDRLAALVPARGSA